MISSKLIRNIAYNLDFIFYNVINSSCMFSISAIDKLKIFLIFFKNIYSKIANENN